MNRWIKLHEHENPQVICRWWWILVDWWIFPTSRHWVLTESLTCICPYKRYPRFQVVVLVDHDFLGWWGCRVNTLRRFVVAVHFICWHNVPSKYVTEFSSLYHWSQYYHSQSVCKVSARVRLLLMFPGKCTHSCCLPISTQKSAPVPRSNAFVCVLVMSKKRKSQK